MEKPTRKSDAMTFDEFKSTGISDWLAEVQKNAAPNSLSDHLNYQALENISIPSYVTAENSVNAKRVKLNTYQKFEVCIPFDLSNPDPDYSLLEGVEAVEFEWKGEALPDIIKGLRYHITTHSEHLESLNSCETTGTITIYDATDPESIQALLKNPVKGFKFLCADAATNGNDDVIEHLQDGIFMADLFIKQVLQKNGEPAECIFFKVTLGEDLYLNLAKIRALKQGWYNLLTHYGLPLSDPTILAETEDLSQSNTETEQNLIRATSMVFSAIAGGAGMVSIKGLIDIERQNPGFGLRMNRNIQLLLKEEGFASHVSDPAKGSYFLDALTAKLAESVWNAFIKRALKSN